MKIVKLTFNYDWPFFRQTPNFSQIWGNYKFIIDENLLECDFWIIYSDYKLKSEKVKCNPENIIFMPAEGYNTSPKFTQKFLNQFGTLITVQKELKHKNIIYAHNANPWFINKSFDELISAESPLKTKLISVVSSNKAFTEGHRKRLNFVQKLKEYYGDKLDVFGRGIFDFEDKWDVLADYKYSIAIENDYCDDWVTEKFFDCLYSETLPFYYGCPNLESYVDKKSFIRIDVNDFDKTIETINLCIENNEHQLRKESLKEEKIKSLNRDQFFPFMVSILDTMDSNLKKTIIKLTPNTKLSNKLKIKSILSKIYPYILLKKNKMSRLKKAIKVLIIYKGKKNVIETNSNHLIQHNRVQPWFAAKGDQTLRLDYDLNLNSIVFDVGGYKGEFAAELFCKYNTNIYIFEPIKSFFDIIKNKFSHNKKVKSYNFGLAGKEEQMEISMSDNSSSIFIKTDETQTIQLKSIINFIKENNIAQIDLIKITLKAANMNFWNH